jgi:ribosome maturation factor RimP
LAEVQEGHILLQEVKKEKGKKAQTVDRLIPLNEITESKVLISFK